LDAHAVQRNLDVDLLVFGETEAYQNFNVVLFARLPRPPSAGQLRPGEFTLKIVFHSSDGVTTVEAPFPIRLGRNEQQPHPPAGSAERFNLGQGCDDRAVVHERAGGDLEGDRFPRAP
jgi:hypothetical protein